MKKILFLSLFAIVATIGFAQEDKAVTERLKQKYDVVVYYEEESYYHILKNGKEGACDLQGNEIIPCKYDDVVRRTGYFWIQLNGKVGAYDLQGNEIIPCKYVYISSYDERGEIIAVVKGGYILKPFYYPINGKWGLYFNNRQIIECKYDRLWEVSDGLIAFNMGGKYTNVKPLTFSGGKWGFLNVDGSIHIPAQYDSVRSFGEGFAAATKKGKWGLIDKNNTLVIPYQYDDVGIFSDGLVGVKQNGKWGFVDVQNTMIISCQYDLVKNFSDGLVGVQQNDKWGFIDTQGRTVIPFRYIDVGPFQSGIARVYDAVGEQYIDTQGNKVNNEVVKSLSSAFSVYAQRYVENKVNEWQKKGEFERTADWQNRVNETTRKEKVNQLTKEAEKEYIAENSKKIILNTELGEYDADNEVFLVKSNLFGNLLVPVPYSEAQSFKTTWNNIKKTPKYFIEKDKLAIAEVTFTTTNDKTYKYSNQASLNYSIAKIDYNFAPIDINIADNSNTPRGNQNINTINLNIGKSDVAVNIPVTNIKNDKTFAVIIANESYYDVSQVEFAVNDGAIFKEYCIKTIGLPEQNISYRANATLNNIRAEIRWIKQVAEKFNGEANIIFYYAGHGTHDEATKSAYLLPTDGLALDIATAYKLDDLYQTLGNLPVKSVTVFLDACYSGTGRDGQMLAQARGVVAKAKQGVPVGNMVVFSSAQGDETAYPYKEKGHGLFTYFLLKKLQETKGDVTLGELSDYVTKQVGQKSIVINHKSQTPTIISSASLANWQTLRLK